MAKRTQTVEAVRDEREAPSWAHYLERIIYRDKLRESRWVEHWVTSTFETSGGR